MSQARLSVRANPLSPVQSLNLKLHRCVTKTTHKRSTKAQVFKWSTTQVIHNSKSLDSYKKLITMVLLLLLLMYVDYSTRNSNSWTVLY